MRRSSPSALRHTSSLVSVPSKKTEITDWRSVGAVPRRRVSTATGHIARRPPQALRISAGRSAAAHRSTLYRARALIFGGGGARMLDRLPVTDRLYLSDCVKTVVEFLTAGPARNLKWGPSEKEFCNITLFHFKTGGLTVWVWCQVWNGYCAAVS